MGWDWWNSDTESEEEKFSREFRNLELRNERLRDLLIKACEIVENNNLQDQMDSDLKRWWFRPSKKSRRAKRK